MFRIEVDDAPITAAINRLIAASGDLTPAMRQIAGLLSSLTEDAFASEAQSGGSAWPDLASVTKGLRKAKGKWPGKKLQVSGQLAASVYDAYGRDFAQVGVGKEYAAIQHLGGPAGRGLKIHIPARPFLPVHAAPRASTARLTQPAQDGVLAILNRHLAAT